MCVAGRILQHVFLPSETVLLAGGARAVGAFEHAVRFGLGLLLPMMAMIGLVVTLKVYWLALAFKPRPKMNRNLKKTDGC